LFGYLIYAEPNYAFKQNGRIGWDAGFILFPRIKGGRSPGLGLGCDYEHNYYRLSAYDKLTHTPSMPVPKSKNKSSYLKKPLEYRHFFQLLEESGT